MRELARSMMRLSWTAPLFGAARLADAVSRPDGAQRLGSSLDAIAWTGHRHLALGLQALFQTGDDLGSEWLDPVFDAIGSASAGEVASGLATVLASAARQTGTSLRIAVPGETGGAARRELGNKIAVYFMVRGARRRLGLPPAGQPFALPELVDRALALDPYQALWLIEGLGHDYAAWQLALDPDPRAILGDLEAPPGALLMLHAGLGLALAEEALRPLAPERPEPAAVRRALRRFVALAEANARPGFADAALESLGLVARCFFPDLVAPVGRALAGFDGPLPGYFWHGVGRAIYFLPVNFLPGYGTTAHAIAMARQEAPDARARHNAVAGVAYAMALVNLSAPEVVELVVREHGATLRDGAFSEGVVSALVMRHATTPEDRGLEILRRHRPRSRAVDVGDVGDVDAGTAGDSVEALWRELIAEPVAAALETLATADPASGRERWGAVYRTLTDPAGLDGVTAWAPASRAVGARS